MDDAGGLVDLIVEADGQQPIGVWSLIQPATKLDITRTQAQKMLKSGEHPVIRGLPQAQAEALKSSSRRWAQQCDSHRRANAK
jgi:hypothetical protein